MQPRRVYHLLHLLSDQTFCDQSWRDLCEETLAWRNLFWLCLDQSTPIFFGLQHFCDIKRNREVRRGRNVKRVSSDQSYKFGPRVRTIRNIFVSATRQIFVDSCLPLVKFLLIRVCRVKFLSIRVCRASNFCRFVSAARQERQLVCDASKNVDLCLRHVKNPNL